MSDLAVFGTALLGVAALAAAFAGVGIGRPPAGRATVGRLLLGGRRLVGHGLIAPFGVALIGLIGLGGLAGVAHGRSPVVEPWVQQVPCPHRWRPLSRQRGKNAPTGVKPAPWVHS